jgi:hypothetical protein
MRATTTYLQHIRHKELQKHTDVDIGNYHNNGTAPDDSAANDADENRRDDTDDGKDGERNN